METLYFVGIVDDGTWIFSNGNEDKIYFSSVIDTDEGTQYARLCTNSNLGDILSFPAKVRGIIRDFPVYDALEFKRNTEKTARELGYQISYDMPPWYSEQEAAKED